MDNDAGWAAFVIGLVIGFLITGVIFDAVHDGRMRNFKKEAITAGVAEYRVDLEGESTFHWKKCKPITGE